MLVIGSAALKYHGINTGRQSFDVDIICTEQEYNTYVAANKPTEVLLNEECKRVVKYGDAIVEFDIAKEGDTNTELLEAYHDSLFAPLDLLYALKMSHRFKKDSPHFYKTMADIKLMRKHGAKEATTEWGKDWFAKREKETYNYSHPKLNVGKDDFFKGDEVPYVYDHDSLHVAVAYPCMPAYLSFKPDDKEVFCSRELFNQCDPYTQFSSVYEEAAVLALERSLIPYEFKPDADKVFEYALMKLCTSISSGWWRDFAWEHFDVVMEMHRCAHKSYTEQFHNGKLLGIIKPFKGEKY